MAKSTNYRGIHISIRYEYGYDYYEIREINKGKKWNDVTLFSTLKEAKQYIDDHYDELVELCNVKESKSSTRKSIKEFNNIRSIRDISKKELMKCEGEKFSVNFRGHNGEIWYDNHYRICYDFGNGVEGVNYSSVNQVIEDLSYEITESKKSARKSIKIGDVVKNENRDDLFGLVYEVKGGRITMYPIDKDTHTYDTRDTFTGNAIDYEVVNFKVAPLKESKVMSYDEFKKSARKSIKEAFDDAITVKEFCFWGYSGNMVEIWTTDGVLCDSFEVRNVGKSEYKNYEIHGWDCAKNTVIIYIKK